MNIFLFDAAIYNEHQFPARNDFSHAERELQLKGRNFAFTFWERKHLLKGLIKLQRL